MFSQLKPRTEVPFPFLTLGEEFSTTINTMIHKIVITVVLKLVSLGNKVLKPFSSPLLFLLQWKKKLKDLTS